jgi:hypothetical protein
VHLRDVPEAALPRIVNLTACDRSARLERQIGEQGQRRYLGPESEGMNSGHTVIVGVGGMAEEISA